MSLKRDLQKQLRKNAMCIDDHLWTSLIAMTITRKNQ